MNTDFLQPELDGETIAVFPLAAGHFDDLYQAAADPLIWIGHPSQSRYKKEEFSSWFDEALRSGGALVVADKRSGRLIGSSRYYDYDEGKSEVAIGFTFLVRDHWGGATNAELKGLMLRHAFGRVKTVWFHVAVSNIRSQKAMSKIGGVVSHIADRSINGSVAQYVFYRIDRPAE